MKLIEEHIGDTSRGNKSFKKFILNTLDRNSNR